ncbi:MAG: head GIN domain-containing protein [Bacteroidia bacterium]
MKIKKLTFILNLGILISLSVQSCVNSQSDSTSSKTFTISDFSGLNLELIGEVYYEQSDSFYLNASGSSLLIEDLKISENDGKLSIELKNKRKYSGDTKKLVIRVGSPRLQAITFKSIGTLHIKNHFESDKLNITCNGVGKIKVDDCHVGIFNLASMSVGLIEIKGTSNETSINSEGVGEIDCSEFKSKNVKVVCRGIGSTSVYAEDNLDISASGIGNINYYGNPVSVKTDISGMGKATKMDH